MRVEKIHNNKFHNLYPLSYIVKAIKQRKMSCRFKNGKTKSGANLWFETLISKGHLTHGGVNGPSSLPLSSWRRSHICNIIVDLVSL
jgi:hypothetical protein